MCWVTNLTSVFLLLMLPGLALSAEEVTRILVRPSSTDPAIDSFDKDHAAYLGPRSACRGRLLLFLPGTGGSGTGAQAFCTFAAEQGYHAIGLSYPTSIPAAAVRNVKNRKAFEDFRTEIIEGGDRSPFVKVNRTNSIEHRLVSLLQFLDRKRPGEQWGQFLDEQGQPAWSKVAVSGQSQGAGHAGLIAIRHEVDRVLMFGGPKDFDRVTDKPAAWYSLKSATSSNRFFSFNHVLDTKGCNNEEQLANCKALGMDAWGEPVCVDNTRPPFGNSRILTTDCPVPPALRESGGHGIPIRGGRRLPDGSLRFKVVWEYMLTVSTERP